MQRLILRISEDLQRGENIDLIVTVALALLISILNGLNIAPTGLVTSITLATLALIALNLLVSRYKIEDIYCRDILNSVQLLTQKPPLFQSELENAKEIWMLGLILRGTTDDNLYSFKRQVSQGAKMRVLIANPQKVNMDVVTKQFARAATPDQVRANFDHTINQYREIGQSAETASCVQLKLLDFVPPFSLYIFPKAKEGGMIYVEMYGYKSPSGSIPKFCITEQGNPIWYRFFLEQFERMFQDAEPVTLR